MQKGTVLISCSHYDDHFVSIPSEVGSKVLIPGDFLHVIEYLLAFGVIALDDFRLLLVVFIAWYV